MSWWEPQQTWPLSIMKQQPTDQVASTMTGAPITAAATVRPVNCFSLKYTRRRQRGVNAAKSHAGHEQINDFHKKFASEAFNLKWHLGYIQNTSFNANKIPNMSDCIIINFTCSFPPRFALKFIFTSTARETWRARGRQQCGATTMVTVTRTVQYSSCDRSGQLWRKNDIAHALAMSLRTRSAALLVQQHRHYRSTRIGERNYTATELVTSQLVLLRYLPG